jgi:hypothetical protein
VSCDGNGVCKKANGQTCSMPSGAECLSGNCVDGYCCNSSCTTTCKACNVTGNLGNCSNIPTGGTDTNPANACTGTQACRMGTCKKANGQTCNQNGDCASDHCNNNVCIP